MSWSISRVLSRTIIHLGVYSHIRSSNLPELSAGHRLSSYLVLLRVEFTVPWNVATHAVRSYRTLSPLPALTYIGGLLSVALVVGSRLPDVIWHSALCSSDFPLVYLSHLSPVSGFYFTALRASINQRLPNQLKRSITDLQTFAKI